MSIVKPDQASVAENFWLHAIPQTACSENSSPTNIKGIVFYGDSPSTLDTTGYSYTDACVDENMSDLTPIISESVSLSPFLQQISSRFL